MLIPSSLVPLGHDSLEDALLEAVADLGVPPSKYEDARSRYGAVGEWLNADGSALAGYKPDIYPQGSFALGTAVKPLGEDHYDVDAVCLLQADKGEISQQALKRLVGDRLLEHGKYAAMLAPPEGGRRCWTVQYADSSRFHLDILPAVPDDPGWLMVNGVPLVFAEHAICITDRETWSDSDWPRSNPAGYALWFKAQNRPRADGEKSGMIRVLASVQDVPEQEPPTPLQQLIMLLKRHRDVQLGADEDKPISIIITTLAAAAYQGEATLKDALLSVVPRMRHAIERRSGVYWVPNPVNPAENFADKWAESPRKATVFLNWLDDVERGHQALISGDPEQVEGLVKKAYGVSLRSRLEDVTPTPVSGVRTSVPALRSTSLFDVRWREAPQWPVLQTHKVFIEGRRRPRGGQWSPYRASDTLGKHEKLQFVATTTAMPPYEIRWQVVNTGDEAARVECLRGGFEHGLGANGSTKEESTLYRGTHWVECFVVKNGVCLARSGPFVVEVE